MKTLLTWALLLGIIGLAGCGQFDKVPARYAGLQGQTVGVMVWANRPVQIDFPDVRVDVARGTQAKLQQAISLPEMRGATFPVPPESIIRYQQNYPQIDAMPIADVAPKMGVQRLIYIEVQELRTRSEMSVNLYRGYMQGSVRVIEIENGQGRVAYEESGIVATFPDRAPAEGIPDADDFQIYHGTLDAFTTEIATRFVSHYRN